MRACVYLQYRTCVITDDIGKRYAWSVELALDVNVSKQEAWNP